jgi:apyrase
MVIFQRYNFCTKITVLVLFQLTFVSDEVLPPELSNNFTFGETTYTLYTNSFLNFGQVSYIHILLYFV